MQLTIIGSTGLTGSHVVRQALQRGHDVVAFTRQPGPPPGDARPKRVVHGDGRDPAAVAAAVRDADGVIAIVSARSRKGPHQAAEVARVLTSAMSEAGVRRLLVTSAYPLVGDRPRILMALLRRILASGYDDLREMERHVTASSLDWTIVRLVRLTNSGVVSPLRLTEGLLENPAAKPRGISRASVAAALLDVVESGAYIRTAVNVSPR